MGCTPERDEPKESVASTAQALVTEELSMDVSLPLGTSVNAVALGANQRLTIADGVRVTAAQGGAVQVISTGSEMTELGADAVLGQPGSTSKLVSQGKVWMRERARVIGDVRTAGAFETQNPWTVDGTVTSSTAIPLATPLTWSVSFQSGGSDVWLEPDQSTAISPGAYGQVNVKARSTLHLSSGIYYVSSLTFEPESQLVVDGADGPVILYVSGSVTWRGTAVGEKVNERLMIAGTKTATIDIDAPLRGSVFAPNAALRLGPVAGSGHEGSYYAKTVEVLARNPIRFVPFAYWGYLFPPKITAECVSRSRTTHAAALFTFKNPLETETKVPGGRMNEVHADVVRGKPLSVFAPGTHDKMYWIPFGGPTLTWSFIGREVSVGPGTRGCGKDDYHWIKADVANAPAGGGATTVSEVMCTGSCAPDLIGWDVHTVPNVGTPPVIPGRAAVGVATKRMQLGGDGIGGAEGYFFLRSFRETPEARAIVESYQASQGTWFPSTSVGAEGASTSRFAFQNVNLDPNRNTIEPPPPYLCFVNGGCPSNWYSLGIPDDSPSLVYFSLSDQPDDFFGGWDHEVQVWMSVDPTTGEKGLFGIFKNGQMLSGQPESCDDGTSILDCACGVSGGYKFCFEVVVDPDEKERLCVDWQTQYIDGGYGEDYLASTSLLNVPASFARARLVSTSPLVEGWTDFVNLDAEGCVPREFAPLSSSVAGALASDPNSVRIEVLGVIDVPGGAHIVVKPEDDMVPRILASKRSDRRYKSSGVDERIRAAAAASYLARQHVQGIDMGLGLAGETFVINPTSGDAVSLGSPHALFTTLNLRPATTLRPSDAALKDAWAHEFGHSVQSGHLDGGRLGMNYDLFKFNDLGLEVPADIPSLPDYCGCDYVQRDFLPAHCMQSVETANAAQVEGFASAYAMLANNRPGDEDCYMAYVKWTLFPGCPTYANGQANQNVDCVHILSMTRAELEQFRVDNDLRDVPTDQELADMRATGIDWVMLRPPVILDCAVATKFRNAHCVDPAVATDDLKDSGTELDWTQFFWALTAPGTPGQAGSTWTVTQAQLPYRDICGPIAAGTECTVEMTWERLQASVDRLVVSGALTLDQQLRFEGAGNSRGVDDSP